MLYLYNLFYLGQVLIYGMFQRNARRNMSVIFFPYLVPVDIVTSSELGTEIIENLFDKTVIKLFNTIRLTYKLYKVLKLFGKS